MEIILAALASTTTMTIFSYIVSNSFRKLYKEPILLQYVLLRLKADIPSPAKQVIAWTIHYAIGLLFVIAFEFIHFQLETKISWYSALIFGSLIGIVGIIGWEIMFHLTNKPHPTDRPGYYTQLFIAHLIFAITTATVYVLHAQ